MLAPVLRLDRRPPQGVSRPRDAPRPTGRTSRARVPRPAGAVCPPAFASWSGASRRADLPSAGRRLCARASKSFSVRGFLFRWKGKLRKWREDRPARGNLFQRDAFLRGKKTAVGGYKRPSFLSRASPESVPLSPLPCDGAMPERDGGGVLDSPAEKTVGNFLNHLRLPSRWREGPGWSS